MSTTRRNGRPKRTGASGDRGAGSRSQGSGRAQPRQLLVSLCLIVKDEADNLPTCVTSARGFADEVVVYDTGSTDDTVAVARHLGAKVVEGYWDDDFSRARNAALAHCRGTWILWLDADETLECADPAALRDLVRRTKPDVDAWSVAIENLTGAGTGAGFVHHAARLFRRERCEWVGRLHEQIARRGSRSGIVQATLEMAGIRHTGYLDKVMVERDKAARNLRLAEREVAEADNIDLGYSLTSLGRASVTAGRLDDAVARCSEALEHTDNVITRRLAMRTIAEAHALAGRADQAEPWVERLRAISGTTTQADVVAVKVALAAGRPGEALALLDRLGPEATDEDGFDYSRGALAALRAEALTALQRPGEAADTWLAVLGEDKVLDTHVGVVVELLRQAGRPLVELARQIPTERQPVFLAQVVQLQPEVADDVLEACFETIGSVAVLAAAASVGRNLPVERALVWSARLRAAGQPQACPLIALTRNRELPPELRARAAATAVRAFGDERARGLFRGVLSVLPPAVRRQVLEETAQLCPTLVEDASAVQAAFGTRAPAASIVIPCYNRFDLTLMCLESLAACTEPGSYEVVVVDNGSRDGTSTLSGIGVPGLRVVSNDTNLGFARACNQGAAASVADTIVFLNNDIEATPGWLPALLDPFGREARVGVTGARLHFPDGTVQHAGVMLGLGKVDGRLHGFHANYKEPGDSTAVAASKPVPAVTGAVLAVRRSVWDAVGGFDEGYWNGAEDVDLCLQVWAKGWTVWYEASSVLIHYESQSGPERWTKLDDNIRRFNERWADAVFDGRLPLPGPQPTRPGGRRPGPGPGDSRVASLRGGAPATGGGTGDGRPLVRWVGDVYADHSLATVSRELCTRLADDRRMRVRVATAEVPPYPADAARMLERVRSARRDVPAAVEVRHQWPPDFSASPDGKVVVIQPWEFKGIPADWVGALRDLVDELWVPTTWVRDCYVEGGVPAEKVVVVPNGVDTAVFRPDGPALPLRTGATTKLLYVGGTIARKGFDVLLDTYRRQFDGDDDVCLVVKPFGGDSVYAGHNLDDEVRRMAADPAAPAVEIVDRRLTRAEMAALYRSCDVLVHPYRGEGFGLPVAEAMACGLPTIVTGYGACLDFCDPSTSWLIDSVLEPCSLGTFTASAAGFWLAQPDADHLGVLLREAVVDADERAAKGEAARGRIAEHFTWDRAAGIAAERLASLAGVDRAEGPGAGSPRGAAGAAHGAGRQVSLTGASAR